jgi:hypothetical protein
MKEKQTQIDFKNGKCIITDKSVNCGFSFELKNIETCDLKFLNYKLHEELLKRGEV